MLPFEGNVASASQKRNKAFAEAKRAEFRARLAIYRERIVGLNRGGRKAARLAAEAVSTEDSEDDVVVIDCARAARSVRPGGKASNGGETTEESELPSSRALERTPSNVDKQRARKTPQTKEMGGEKGDARPAESPGSEQNGAGADGARQFRRYGGSSHAFPDAHPTSEGCGPQSAPDDLSDFPTEAEEDVLWQADPSIKDLSAKRPEVCYA